VAREIRFRLIVLIFNIVIVLSFLFVFLFPLLLLGPSYFSLFISHNWVAGLLFLAALAAVNLYFAVNGRLFGLLEKEDWPVSSPTWKAKYTGRAACVQSRFGFSRTPTSSRLPASRHESLRRKCAASGPS